MGVYLIMTCLNGYYHAPNLDSLAESLLKAPGGAAAVWASSGFTVPTEQEKLDAVMVRTLYERTGITLGRAIHIAKTGSVILTYAGPGYFWEIRSMVYNK